MMNNEPNGADQEITLEKLQEDLSELDQLTQNKLAVLRRDHGGILFEGWELALRTQLLKRAREENPDLIPLIMANYSIDRRYLYKVNPRPSKVNEPMNGANLSVTGHVSRSTLWIIDEEKGLLQTMRRLLVEDQSGERRLIDVYSLPVPLYRIEREMELINVEAAEPSLMLKLLNYVTANKLEILGWQPIAEIGSETMPSYKS